ncbi:phosphatase PAP2 family protein [Paraburkholderia sp. MMS20-SJTR3]|uniref:Phosphatase PAP2 family protein n=1 Tax=Paraburkholderia sejongensis TaxID=2886946 RepID=A0ABS8K3J7_9BURK|nr:phosphatase PAP2 family protein [Paraburkholderia sp. MMS20-SJTR3]MCC8396739.1 phosphatase PAP2 family protein [Paraburkholderia sp. MMS20-SJTR3]
MPDLPIHLWYSITSLGGAGMTLPLALAIAIWLAVGYSWRLSVCWLALLGSAIGIVTVTKLAFLGWGVGIRELDFTGVSGHAMLSTSVYPVALFLMLLPARPALRLFGVLVGLAAGIAVGLSRVVLSAHSPSEAVTGCLVGALAALVFVRIAWNAEPGRLSVLPVAVSMLVLAIVMHGVHVPTQRWVTDIALKVSGHDRPFIRAKWKATGDFRPQAAPLSQTLNTLEPVPRAPIA